MDREDRIFAGDGVIWSYIERLRDGEVPLIEGARQRLSITPGGADVLLGRADAIKWNGIDRWLGGVHLNGRAAEWRWDEERRKVIRKDMSGANRG